jgi:hypothetical protein
MMQEHHIPQSVSCVVDWTCLHIPNLCVEILIQISQKVPVFGDMAFEEVTKLKWSP